MTYVALSVVALALIAAVTIPVLRQLPGRPLLLTGLVLVALTAVFDNVIVGVGLVDYDPHKISGARVGWAPIEDFAYTIGAVMIIPAVWSLLSGRSRAGDS